MNLGISYQLNGNLEFALACYNDALNLNQNDPNVLCNIGNLYKDKNEYAYALKYYNKALEIDPDNWHAINSKGVALDEEGYHTEAINLFLLAFEKNKSYKEALANAFHAMERRNDLKAFRKAIDKAKVEVKPIFPEITLFEILLLYREKNFHAAKALISSIDIELLSILHKVKYWEVCGKVYDKLGLYDDAYASFSNMNSTSVRISPQHYKQSTQYFNQRLSDLRAIEVSSYIELDFNDINLEKKVFVIGFPRSGTTLLQTVLAAHPEIEVIEEQPAVAEAKKHILSHGSFNLINSYPKLSVRNKSLEVYEEMVFNSSTDPSAPIKVDKLPLNLFDIPTIKFLFPKAMFICALRHPLDCVLSNWMQNYRYNAAMANMSDLGRIVAFYDLAMAYFEKCKEKLPINIHELKYEDLVENTNLEADKLFQFLNLELPSNLEQRRRKYVSNEHIRTPSYSQVTQPIYNDSLQKWKNYRNYLSRYDTFLSHWITKYGY